jgi:hypothetical protein
MATDYLAKLRKNRELTVSVGKWKFTARRPTDAEAGPLLDPSKETTLYAVARDYVTGWEGVVEDDVIGGGGQDPVPFSSELWTEWVADRREVWHPIGTKVVEAYLLHWQHLEDAGKN